jgi:hypothetical protein
MNEPKSMLIIEAHSELLKAAQSMQEAFENLLRSDVTYYESDKFINIRSAHRDLAEAVTQSEAVDAFVKSKR